METLNVQTLSCGLFPKEVWIADANGTYRHAPGWRYMVAAGNRCEIGEHLAVPGSPTVMCQLLDGAHAGVRFDPREASFLWQAADSNRC